MVDTHKKNIPWNKGKTGVYSDEVRKTMSINRKGKATRLGMKHSQETKDKLRQINLGKIKVVIPNEQLINLYCNQKKNAYELGRLYNCSPSTIYHKLKLLGITPRSLSESRLYSDTAFKKGLIPWNKGVSPSKKQIEKQAATMREAYRTGRIKHHLKNKTYEERYGIKAIPLKNKLSEIHKQKILMDPEILKRMREQAITYYKTHSSPMKGKKHSEMAINIIKEKRKFQVMPLKDSSIEVKIQDMLKELELDFFTHQYMEIEHGYQCDIYVPNLNLVIECDGNYWHQYPTGREIDHIRTQELLDKGFKVLRLWEVEIKQMDIGQFKERLV